MADTNKALLPALAVAGAGLAFAALVRALPHRKVVMEGDKGVSRAKALHIRLQARPGREDEVEQLLWDIFDCVERETGTTPWFGTRRDHSTFEIFEAFPNELGRQSHLFGEGAKILKKRSRALLAEPAHIELLDVLMSKGFANKGQRG